MTKNKKLDGKDIKRIAKNIVSINLLSIWFAFMCGYLITISNYVGASMSGLGLYFTLLLKEKQKEEIENGKKKKR